MFVNTLPADGKYPVRDCENLRFPIEMELSYKQKFFSQFFVSFIEYPSIFKYFRKKDARESSCISGIRNCQNLVRPLSKKRRFRTSFCSEHVKRSQTLVKSAWEHFYHICWALWGEITWKISPSLDFEIPGLFVNTLIAEANYPFVDSRDSQCPIKMQLS